MEPKEIIHSVLGLLILSCASCTMSTDWNETIPCTGEELPGISVKAIDIKTGKALIDVYAVARDGAYRDTFHVTAPEAPVAYLAYERPSEYGVTVQREGYKTWHRENVEVSSGECHVITTKLKARLEHK